jgi:hypothetical protein
MLVRGSIRMSRTALRRNRAVCLLEGGLQSEESQKVGWLQSCVRERQSGTQKENGALSYRSIHDLQWVGGVGHRLLGRCGGGEAV